MCDREHFQELVFPGFSREARRVLPKTVVELFEWEELQLDLDSIASNAATVLKNIKAKGAKQGQIMDAETEKVLMPQIAQEALSKRVLEEVQKLNRKLSSMIANSVKPVAAPTDERAERNVLDDDVCDRLRLTGLSVQAEFLGDDWIPVLQKDLLRFVRDEKMSLIDRNGVAVGDVKVEEVAHQRIAWLEHDDDLRDTYPALYELVDNLHGLAYELNAKNVLSDVTLLEPGKGCTLLTVHPVGSSQKLRLDTRQNVEGFDSGIRATVCYNIHLRVEATRSSAAAAAAAAVETGVNGRDGALRGYSELLFGTPRRGATATKKTRETAASDSDDLDMTRIPVEDDLLTIHRSAVVRNGRTAEVWTEAEAREQGLVVEGDGDGDRGARQTPGVVWATVHHFICGRDAPLQASAPLSSHSSDAASPRAKDDHK
eukprot:gene8592-6183_t